MQLKIIDHPDAAGALSAALAVRHAGDVPLIVDWRAPIADDLQNCRLPEATAWAALTSGTTGAPKIVVRMAASWQVAFQPLNVELGLRAGDGLWMPVHQVSSMALFSAAWAQDSGFELVIPTPTEAGLARATAAHVTPAWLERLLTMLEAGHSSTLDTVLVGGDRLPPELLHRAEAVGLRVVTYAGAAELSFVAWDRGDGLRPFEGVATRIADGQLWVSSPQIALDVFGGTLRRDVIDGIEWATVGDRVTEDHGVLEFLGRGDGAILTAGATVVPAEVEAVLHSHPDVTGSLVMGQPDTVLGQRVVAWVEGPADVGQLRDWVRSRLPKAARPVQWHAVEHLARTASGKIRRVLPEEA